MSAATGTRTKPRVTSRARPLFWGAVLLGGAAITAMALVFAWPGSDSGGGRFDLGHVDDYAIGSVSTIGEGEFHLVRLGNDTFIAMSWRDPHSECAVFSRADDRWRPEIRGSFRDPCHGSSYRMDGTRVFGPSPRDLDRFVVSIVNEDVIVDTARYVCGWSPPGAACVGPGPTP